MTCLKPLIKFLETIDIFGLAITFRIFQQKNYKTKFGGFVTICISSVVFYQLFSVIKDVFDQNSPNVIQQQNYVQQPEVFLFKPDTFTFAFGLQDPLGKHFKNEKVYTVKSIMQTNKRVFNNQTGVYDLVVKQVEAKLTTCTMENFKIKGTEDYFNKLPLDNLYCFDVNETGIGVEGEFSALVYKQLNIQVHECLDANKCEESSVRKKLLERPRLGIYASDNIIQVTNKDQPYQSIGKNMFWVTGIDFEKEVRYQMINNYIHTDVGIIKTNIKTHRVVSFSSEREQVLNRRSSLIYNFFFNYEKNKEFVYYRKYLKLDQAFSQVGGIFNVLVGLGCLICWPIAQLQLNRKIINSVFQIEVDELNQTNKKQGEHNDNQEEQQTKFDMQQNHQHLLFLRKEQDEQHKLSNSLTPNNNKSKSANYLKSKLNKIKNTQEHLKQFFSFTFTKVKFKFCEYFMTYMNFGIWKTPKKQIIEYGTDILYSHIDILNIIHKLIEFEKLKHLLLNENQIKLFEYLPKPALKLSQIKQLNQNRNLEYPKKSKLNKHSLSFNVLARNQSQQQDSNFKQEEEDFGLYFTAQKTLKEKAEQAYKAFYQICTPENQKSDIDKKLIEMIDPKLVQYFIDNQNNFNYLNLHQRSRSPTDTKTISLNDTINYNPQDLLRTQIFLNENINKTNIESPYNQQKQTFIAPSFLGRKRTNISRNKKTELEDCEIDITEQTLPELEMYSSSKVKSVNLVQLDKLNENDKDQIEEK